MAETTGEQPVFYLRNEHGTVVRETDPSEVERLGRETGYKPISAEEGRAAFAGKQRVFEKLDVAFEGELSKAAEAGKAGK